MGVLSINSNLSAQAATRRLGQVDSGLGKTLEKLSTGMRINRASDDPAGLAVSSGLANQGRLYSQADRNIRDALSAIDILDGALGEQSSILTRLAELAEQSANGSLSSRQRSSLQSEYAQLLQEFARTASTTTFNSQSLALADRGGLSRLNIQSGINGSANSILSTALLDTGSLSGTIGLTHIPTDDSATLTAFSAFAATNPTAEQILERYSVIHHVSLEGAPAGEDMFLVFFRDPEANFMIAKGLVREGAGNTYAEAEFEGEKTTNDSIGFDFDQNGVITAGTAQQTLTIFDTSPSFHGNITLDYRALRLLQGDTSAIDFTGLENASRARVALDVVTARISDLASQRGQIGATSSRIQASLAVTNAAKENTAAALSRVRDVDVAMESSQLISQTLLKQAAISVLAQANQQPQLAISLLRA